MWRDKLHSKISLFISSVFLCCIFLGCAKSESNSTDQEQENVSNPASTEVSSSFSSHSPVAVDPVDLNPPSAPTGLVASATSSSQIHLSWTDTSTNEGGFKIERSTDGAIFSQIATTGSNATSYAATGLSASTQYHFRIASTNAAADSAYSNIAIAMTADGSSDTQLTSCGTLVRAGKPGADNTGPCNSSILVPSGSITVTQDGAVIENIEVTGMILVKANNVTIRNFRVTGESYYGILMDSASGAYTRSGLLLEDGEVTGQGIGDGINLYHSIARRIHIHHIRADGGKIGGETTVEKSYVHHLGMVDGSSSCAINYDPYSCPHSDGFQVMGGNNITFRGNFIDNIPGKEADKAFVGQTAALFLNPTENGGNNFLVEGNWLNGGTYTIYTRTLDNPKLMNNVFGRGAQYGVLNEKYSSGFLWSNNRWMDTLELIPWNGQQ